MGEGPGHLDAANAKDRVCIKHKVISALTASFSIGVITSTIDLLSGNAHEEGWGARTGVLCERISVKFSGESHRGGGSPE